LGFSRLGEGYQGVLEQRKKNQKPWRSCCKVMGGNLEGKIPFKSRGEGRRDAAGRAIRREVESGDTFLGQLRISGAYINRLRKSETMA